MSWKQEISKYYQDRIKEEEKYLKPPKEEISLFIENIVIPAFEEIEAVLSKYVNEIKIRKFVYNTRICFKDPVIDPKRVTAFGVDLSNNYSITFPFWLNGSYCSGSFDEIKIENLNSIKKDDIIDRFMNFFNKREKEIKEFQEDLLNVYPL